MAVAELPLPPFPYEKDFFGMSPYKLLWCGDYYYVLGYSEKKSKVINFK